MALYLFCIAGAGVEFSMWPRGWGMCSGSYIPCACDQHPNPTLAQSPPWCFEICADSLTSSPPEGNGGSEVIAHLAPVGPHVPQNPSWGEVDPSPMVRTVPNAVLIKLSFSADRRPLYPQTQALTARRLRPRHPLLPDHAHMPGPLHPEDAVLSPTRVPTGRPCPGTRSSPQRDLSALLQEVSRPVDWPLV